MKKRQNRKMIVTVAAVIVIAVFFTLSLSGENPIFPKEKPAYGCTSTECLTDAAVAREDPTICNNIENGTQVKDCYRNVSQVAVEKGNDSICEGIGDKSIKDGCNAAVAAAVSGGGGSSGSAQSQVHACSLSGPLYQECLLQFAKETLDPAFCSLIIDENERNRCLMILAVMNYDESLCDQISNAEKVNICHLYMTREFIPYNETGGI